MKRITSVLVVCVMALSMLCGCGNKIKATDIGTVIVTVKSLGYYDESHAEIGSVDGGELFQGFLTNNWIFAFYDLDEAACDEKYSQYASSEYVTNKTENGNYCVIECTRGELYTLVIRVDNTLLGITGLEADKEDIQELAKEIGYYN